MKHLEIKAFARTSFGKKSSADIRRAGQVPCVVYGAGETVHFSVEKTDLKQLIYTPQSFIVVFDIEGAKETVVMREVQYHPVNDEPIHIDFYRVEAGKPITIELPVTLSGTAEGVKLGGKLQLAKRKVFVSALEEFLPDTINVDVTELGLGKSIFVGDLSIENLTILTPATTAICAVRMTRAARGAAAAAAKGKK
ncbi:MAG: 50S ribosomal protein L25/general stress protein Ctc [Rikenellaceae bacterium]